MKKGFLLLLLAGLAVLMFTSSALAQNGPHKGPGFATDTDACAGCHRAHTGVALKLLKEGTTRYTFCTSCHNGTGANNNVVTGTFEGDANIVYEGHDSKTDGDAGKGLNGGGFESAFAYTGRSGRSSGHAAFTAGDKQRHDVTGGDTVTKGAWGGGNTGPSQDIANFTCTSCHDPHGTENSDSSERYRILKGSAASPVNGKTTGDIKSNEIAEFGKHDYTKDAYQTGIADFCIACHTQYKTDQGTVNGGSAGTYNAGDGKGSVVRYRHKITNLTNGNLDGIRGNGTSVWANLNAAGGGASLLPLEQITYSSTASAADSITCLTCHQSHGTSATMTASATVSPANSRTLLRLNNRGVCEACHNK